MYLRIIILTLWVASYCNAMDKSQKQKVVAAVYSYLNENNKGKDACRYQPYMNRLSNAVLLRELQQSPCLILSERQEAQLDHNFKRFYVTLPKSRVILVYDLAREGVSER